MSDDNKNDITTAQRGYKRYLADQMDVPGRTLRRWKRIRQVATLVFNLLKLFSHNTIVYILNLYFYFIGTRNNQVKQKQR